MSLPFAFGGFVVCLFACYLSQFSPPVFSARGKAQQGKLNTDKEEKAASDETSESIGNFGQNSKPQNALDGIGRKSQSARRRILPERMMNPDAMPIAQMNHATGSTFLDSYWYWFTTPYHVMDSTLMEIDTHSNGTAKKDGMTTAHKDLEPSESKKCWYNECSATASKECTGTEYDKGKNGNTKEECGIHEQPKMWTVFGKFNSKYANADTKGLTCHDPPDDAKRFLLNGKKFTALKCAFQMEWRDAEGTCKPNYAGKPPALCLVPASAPKTNAAATEGEDDAPKSSSRKSEGPMVVLLNIIVLMTTVITDTVIIIIILMTSAKIFTQLSV